MKREKRQGSERDAREDACASTHVTLQAQYVEPDARVEQERGVLDDKGPTADGADGHAALRRELTANVVSCPPEHEIEGAGDERGGRHVPEHHGGIREGQRSERVTNHQQPSVLFVGTAVSRRS